MTEPLCPVPRAWPFFNGNQVISLIPKCQVCPRQHIHGRPLPERVLVRSAALFVRSNQPPADLPWVEVPLPDLNTRQPQLAPKAKCVQPDRTTEPERLLTLQAEQPAFVSTQFFKPFDHCHIPATIPAELDTVTRPIVQVHRGPTACNAPQQIPGGGPAGRYGAFRKNMSGKPRSMPPRRKHLGVMSLV